MDVATHYLSLSRVADVSGWSASPSLLQAPPLIVTATRNKAGGGYEHDNPSTLQRNPRSCQNGIRVKC